MTMASLRREINLLKQKVGRGEDVHLVPTIDLLSFDPADLAEYDANEGDWEAQRRIVERVTGQPFNPAPAVRPGNDIACVVIRGRAERTDGDPEEPPGA